jgi:hypothetical protein
MTKNEEVVVSSFASQWLIIVCGFNSSLFNINKILHSGKEILLLQTTKAFLFAIMDGLAT